MKNSSSSSSSITKLYTHPQVWGQCERYLSRNLKGVERQDVSSTSKAAEIILKDSSETGTGTGTRTRTKGKPAAIASRFAAEYHGLDIIDADIEDQADNTTRFLVLRNARSNRTAQILFTGNSDSNNNNNNITAKKTLISFTVNQASPGALADALLVFKTYSLNLTSINTRPSRKFPWHYIFFVECRWALGTGDEDTVNQLSTSLRAIVEDCRDLGTWTNQLPHV